MQVSIDIEPAPALAHKTAGLVQAHSTACHTVAGHKLDHGVVGTGNSFVAMYYYLTFNHLVHASWGILGMLWVLARLAFGGYNADDHAGLEALACYWHATDIIWLVIFPLFYVLA